MSINTANMSAREKDDFALHLSAFIADANREQSNLPIFNACFVVDPDVLIQTKFMEAMDYAAIESAENHDMSAFPTIQDRQLQQEFKDAAAPFVLPVQTQIQGIVDAYGGELRNPFPSQDCPSGDLSVDFITTPAGWRRIADLSIITSMPAWTGGPNSKNIIAAWQQLHDTIFTVCPDLKTELALEFAIKDAFSDMSDSSEIWSKHFANKRRFIAKRAQIARHNIDRRRVLDFLARNAAQQVA